MAYPIALGSNALDLTGQTIGGATMLRLAHSSTRCHRWHFRCSCGAEAIRDTAYIRKHEISGTPIHCEACAKVARARGGSLRRGRVPSCSICHLTTHNVRRCPQRPKSKRGCSHCEGLPHRRPIGRPCACGGEYAPDVVTLKYIGTLPAESRRTEP